MVKFIRRIVHSSIPKSMRNKVWNKYGEIGHAVPSITPASFVEIYTEALKCYACHPDPDGNAPTKEDVAFALIQLVDAGFLTVMDTKGGKHFKSKWKWKPE